jgi:hypothetical protein
MCRTRGSPPRVDAVYVSNHGGRQLDAVPAIIDVLLSIVDALDGRLPIIIDGGIRHGTDVVTALALGTNAVAVWRPGLWGLAVGGQTGVAHVLEALAPRLEYDDALRLRDAQRAVARTGLRRGGAVSLTRCPRVAMTDVPWLIRELRDEVI